MHYEQMFREIGIDYVILNIKKEKESQKVILLRFFMIP